MVRQYSQKFEFSTSSEKYSVMTLSCSSSSGVKNRFMISMQALSDRLNLLSVWASWPRSCVARHSE